MPYAPWLAAFDRLLARELVLLAVQVRPRAGGAAGRRLVLALRSRWGLSGAVLAARRARQVDAGARGRRARRVAAHDAARARRARARGRVRGDRPARRTCRSSSGATTEVLAAYERQSGRSITPESVWYLLLRPFDLAHVRTHISFSAGAPSWANVARGRCCRSLSAARARRRRGAVRGTQRAAVALAALAPASFLLTNRIFSPQFMLVAVRGVGARRGARRRHAPRAARGRRRDGARSAANEFVYPFALPHYAETWVICSAVLFSVALALTGWLAFRAATAAGSRPEDSAPPVPAQHPA